MGRVDPERAQARLGAERRGDHAGWLEPGNPAANLYLDELERLAEDLRDRLAELERAAQHLAVGMYGLSVARCQPIPDKRVETFSPAERTVQEERATAEGRGG